MKVYRCDLKPKKKETEKIESTELNQIETNNLKITATTTPTAKEYCTIQPHWTIKKTVKWWWNNERPQIELKTKITIEMRPKSQSVDRGKIRKKPKFIVVEGWGNFDFAKAKPKTEQKLNTLKHTHTKPETKSKTNTNVHTQRVRERKKERKTDQKEEKKTIEVQSVLLRTTTAKCHPKLLTTTHYLRDQRMGK